MSGAAAIGGRNPVKAVLFDAYGTLIELDDPVGRLGAALAAIGHPTDPGVVAAAFRAEVATYRRLHHLGADTVGLEALRTVCAATFAAEIPTRPAVEDARRVLVDGIRYRLFADAAPTLDALAAAGIRLGIVSDWDCSLGLELAALGIVDRFGVVATSAALGARKPDPRIFRMALDELGVTPAEAIHVGDEPSLDGTGAAAAGLPFVHLDRSIGGSGDITSLTELAGRLSGEPDRSGKDLPID